MRGHFLFLNWSYVEEYPSESREFDLSERYSFGIQSGIVFGAGIDFPVGKNNKVVTQILISRTWPITDFEYLRLQRTRGVFTMGYAF
jgi:hypothetical protein